MVKLMTLACSCWHVRISALNFFLIENDNCHNQAIILYSSALNELFGTFIDLGFEQIFR